MLTSKQRARLRAIASKEQPIFQIGKEGISQAQIQGMSDALDKRELIKISVLKSSELSAKELIITLSDKLSAQPVAAIGNRIILYKFSNKDIKHIEL